MTITFKNADAFFCSLLEQDPNLEITEDGPCFGHLQEWKLPDGDGELFLQEIVVRLSDKIKPKITKHLGVNIRYELYQPEAKRIKFPGVNPSESDSPK